MPNLQLSDKGRLLLEAREGCVLTVYDDVRGFPTIGYGHLIERGENYTTITQQQADALFQTDIQIYVNNLNNVLVTPATQDEFDAMVSLSYNIGINGFDNSTVLRRFNTGDIIGAANAFMLWDKPPAIYGRRYNEYKQFKSLI
jgi:lysozyme